VPTFTIDGAPATFAEVVSALAKEGEAFAYVPKSRFDAEVTARRTAESTLGEKSEAHTAAEKALAKLAKQHEALTAEAGELRTAAELGTIGIRDAQTQRALRAIHAAEMSGAEKPIPLTDWIQSDAGKAHPVVAAVLPKPGDGNASGTGTRGTPGTSNGTTTTQPRPGARRTIDQINAYFASAEFKALTPADKAKAIDAAESEVNATGNAGA
jgi:hypothetical protein